MTGIANCIPHIPTPFIPSLYHFLLGHQQHDGNNIMHAAVPSSYSGDYILFASSHNCKTISVLQ